MTAKLLEGDAVWQAGEQGRWSKLPQQAGHWLGGPVLRMPIRPRRSNRLSVAAR